MKTSTFVAIFCALACSSLFGQTDSVKSFTEPFRSIDIAASETGTLSGIHVSEGDHVSAGSILARLNEDVLAASRAIAIDTKNAKGKLNSAMRELKMKEDRVAKLEGLFERRHASQIEVDRARGQLDIARAQVQTVQDELNVRELELKRIEAQIEQRRLRSPINGIVTRLFKDVGEFVSASDPNVVTVVQLDPLLVVFMVPQDKARQLSTNQKVTVHIGSDRKSAIGTVDFVSPTADAQSGTCRVKVVVPNRSGELHSGQVCYLDTSRALNGRTAEKFQVSATRNGK